MKKQSKSLTDAVVLRQKAEEQLKKRKAAQSIVSTTETNMLKLIHELEVHQIELEMQNEELRKTQLQLQTSRDRYHLLYDCAPVGFITLNKKGYITDANQSACILLGCSKPQLQGTKHAKYIHNEDLERFYLFFKQQLNYSNKQHSRSCVEVRVKQANKQFIPVLCQGLVAI